MKRSPLLILCMLALLACGAEDYQGPVGPTGIDYTIVVDGNEVTVTTSFAYVLDGEGRATEIRASRTVDEVVQERVLTLAPDETIESCAPPPPVLSPIGGALLQHFPGTAGDGEHSWQISTEPLTANGIAACPTHLRVDDNSMVVPQEWRYSYEDNRLAFVHGPGVDGHPESATFLYGEVVESAELQGPPFRKGDDDGVAQISYASAGSNILVDALVVAHNVGSEEDSYRVEASLDLGDDGRWLGWEATVTGGRVDLVDLGPKTLRAVYHY